MQEHVELEVSLEVIMSEIAQTMFKLSHEKDTQKKELINSELNKLIELQEEAYKGNRKAVKKILNREYINYE